MRRLIGVAALVAAAAALSGGEAAACGRRGGYTSPSYTPTYYTPCPPVFLDPTPPVPQKEIKDGAKEREVPPKDVKDGAKEREVERGAAPAATDPAATQFVTATIQARKQYCYACKIDRGNGYGWETYAQTGWKNGCDAGDKNKMLYLRDQMRARGVPAKVVEKERDVN